MPPFSTIELIDLFHVVDLEIRLWTARKKLTVADLKLADGSELPPEKLASLGSKRVMNPEALAPFARLKRRAERESLAVGTRFIGGYAVPKEKVGHLMSVLASIREEYLKAKDDFLAEYNQTVEAWIKDNPGWEDAIRRSVESEQYVREQLQFSIRVFQVQPVEGHKDGLEQEMGGLAAQLRREVAQQIKTAWESSFEGRISVGQKALRPIRSALEKAKGLMFLDGGLGPIIESVEKTLSGLPRSGEIQGLDFAAVCGAIHILSGIPEARLIQLNPPVEEKEEIVEESADQEKEPPNNVETRQEDPGDTLPKVFPKPVRKAPASMQRASAGRVAVEAPDGWF